MATKFDLSDPTTANRQLPLALGVVSLFLSGWAFLASFDDSASERDVERRLACLELPGPNDCGADGD